ncbi:hypothetical protein [Acidipropionibacterium timonense]|uniref:hypothetical protein n=1 Tax=Acidipropionibacterium timonense TaxID=2161818 RepID=UPI00103272A9|nr:hypothetical protein [Acidipropionibacterium timonense]
MTKDDFLALWTTHSQWLVAPHADRERWMAGWREVLETDPAVRDRDDVDIPMTTECWVARQAA